ncbi:hypothetical protein [Curtobacterium sp. MCBA15_016]|uniref:hypothetical protein n=1 Tax=Curtobacterium sp. MCBA15_016 TaxID=1898740 RepID=UPI00111437E3|nr:hypothetical protein [Curtobacterium sp. MCBA15_016]
MPGPWDLTLTLVIAGSAALLTASAAAAVVVQRMWADRRSQLWDRIDKALTLATSTDDETRAVGMLLVEELVKSNRLKWSEAPPARLTKFDKHLLTEVSTALGPKEPR